MSEPVASPGKSSLLEQEADPQVQQRLLQAIAPIADQVLSRFKVRQIVGKLYKLHRFGASELLVTRISDNSLVFRAYKDKDKDDKQDWKAIACQIKREDYNNFKRVQLELNPSNQHTIVFASRR